MTEDRQIVLPDGEVKRQAVSALRGYAYQLISTAIAWIDLKDDQTLLVEVAEDYCLLSKSALNLHQIKNTKPSLLISLRSKSVISAINSVWRYQRANKNKQVTLVFLTTSEIGREKNTVFPGNLNGLHFWNEAKKDLSHIDKLRQFLVSLNLDSDLIEWLKISDVDKIHGLLIEKITWICGSNDLHSVQDELLNRLILLCEAKKVTADRAVILRDAMLFDLLNLATEATAIQRQRRRVDFITLFDRATTISVRIGDLTAVLDNEAHAERDRRTGSHPAIDILILRGRADQRGQLAENLNLERIFELFSLRLNQLPAVEYKKFVDMIDKERGSEISRIDEALKLSINDWDEIASALRDFALSQGHRRDYPIDIPAILKSVLKNYLSLTDALSTAQNDDPRVERIRDAARQALASGRVRECEDLLMEADEIDRKAIYEHRGKIITRKKSIAMTRSERSSIARSQLRFRDSAANLQEAAEFALEDEENVIFGAELLLRAAKDLLRAGEEIGDKEALLECASTLCKLADVAQSNGLGKMWVMSQIEMAKCYRIQGDRSDNPDHLIQSERILRHVLKSPEIFMNDDCTNKAEFELGSVLFILGERDSASDNARLIESQKYLESSRRKRISNSKSNDYAVVLNSLSLCYRLLGERTNNVDLLKRAVETHRSSMKIWTVEDAPLDWAGAQNNLGLALSSISRMSDNIRYMRMAVRALKAAIEVWDRFNAVIWSRGGRMNLAISLSVICVKTRVLADFEEAVSIYKEARSQFPVETAPVLWAQVQYNLGMLFFKWGDLKKSVSHYEQASLIGRETELIFARSGRTYQSEVAKKLTDDAEQAIKML